MAFATADDALFEFGRLQPRDTALVHARAGGMRIAAIQLAKRAGAPPSRRPAGPDLTMVAAGSAAFTAAALSGRGDLS